MHISGRAAVRWETSVGELEVSVDTLLAGVGLLARGGL